MAPVHTYTYKLPMKRDAMCKKIKDYMGTPYTSTCMLRYKEFHIGMTRLVKNKWE